MANGTMGPGRPRTDFNFGPDPATTPRPLPHSKAEGPPGPFLNPGGRSALIILGHFKSGQFTQMGSSTSNPYFFIFLYKVVRLISRTRAVSCRFQFNA